MRRLGVMLLLMVSANATMLGQTGKFDLFGGYSLERIAPGCGTDYTCGSSSAIGATTDLNGWVASATGYLSKSLGISLQISGNYNGSVRPSFLSVHRYGLQTGPVYTFRWQRASAFAHGLIGFVHQGSAPQSNPDSAFLSYTKFMFSVGGGLDIKVSRHLSVRAGQLDYERQPVPVNSSSSSSYATYPANGLRYSAGVVLQF